MDKSWIKLSCNTPEYLVGLNNFLDFAFQYGASANTIVCPCSKCGFRKWRTREEVYDHLLCKPFPQGYTFLCRHGESISGEPIMVNGDGMRNTEYEYPMQIMINDAFGLSNTYTNEESFRTTTWRKYYGSRVI